MFSRRHLQTSDTVAHALAALSRCVSEQEWFRAARTPFVGSVWDSGFRISRAVRGRDSWNPVLYGRVSQGAGGAEIRVLMTLHPLVWVGQMIFSGTALFGLVSHPSDSPLLLMGFGAMPWILAGVFFRINASRAMRQLKACLNATDCT